MSDTDKTRPEWVQVKDPTNRGWLREDHHHEKGICDIEDYDERYPWTWRNHCGIWPSRKAVKEGIYPRASKAVSYYTYGYIRAERATWRELRNRIIKGDLDAADESPLTYSPRHRGIWDAY